MGKVIFSWHSICGAGRVSMSCSRVLDMGLDPGYLLPYEQPCQAYMDWSPELDVTLHLLPVSSLPGGISGVYPAWWRCRWPTEQNASCASVCKTTESHNVIHKWLTLTSSVPKKASRRRKNKIDIASVHLMVWHEVIYGALSNNKHFISAPSNPWVAFESAITHFIWLSYKTKKTFTQFNHIV